MTRRPFRIGFPLPYRMTKRGPARLHVFTFCGALCVCCNREPSRKPICEEAFQRRAFLLTLLTVAVVNRFCPVNCVSLATQQGGPNSAKPRPNKALCVLKPQPYSSSFQLVAELAQAHAVRSVGPELPQCVSAGLSNAGFSRSCFLQGYIVYIHLGNFCKTLRTLLRQSLRDSEQTAPRRRHQRVDSTRFALTEHCCPTNHIQLQLGLREV